MGNDNISIKTSINQIDKKKWELLVHDANPFYQYEWLKCLEETGCIGQATGWVPLFFVQESGNEITGVICAYIKSHSYGEYVFDWQWANAYHSAGIEYYPKLILASAFTPVQGPRMIHHASHSIDGLSRLLESAIDFAKKSQLSSIHCLFCIERECQLYEQYGFLRRIAIQYQFKNKPFESFDHFLQGLKSNRRKTIRQERKSIANLNLEIDILSGTQIEAQHMDQMWLYYLDTHKRKGQMGYLNELFFKQLYRSFADHIVLVMVKKQGEYIAGSMSLTDENHLYGRYWGGLEDVKFLHFECCIYQLIEWSIKHKQSIFDAGAQGQHKFQRGFHPVITHSMHLMLRHDGQKMIQDYLAMETPYVEQSYKAHIKASVIKGIELTN